MERGSIASGGRTVRERLQVVAQLAYVDGLDEVLVEPEFLGASSIVFAIPTGDRDENEIPSPRSGAKSARHFVTVQVGQSDIENRGVGSEPIRLGERCDSTVRDVHFVSDGGEDQTQAVGGIRIVIYQQDPTRVLYLRRTAGLASRLENVRHGRTFP